MAYSCSDYTDDVLERMGMHGFIRQDDCAGDNPSAQAELTCNAIDKLAALVSALREATGFGGSLRGTDVGRRLASLATSIVPKYVASDEYEPSVSLGGDDEAVVRWVLDLANARLVCAQRLNDGFWEDLDASSTQQLTAEMQERGVRESPGEHNAYRCDEMPAWRSATH